MKSLTIKHFRYFLALAEARHFGRAAQACSISQPALSLQIKELEDLLGVRLVERRGRQILLTGLGEEFARRAFTVLREVDEIGDLVRSRREDLSGPFRLGVIPTIGPYFLPDVVQALTRRYPGIEITIRETVTSKLEEAIQAGELDAAIVALPVSVPAFAEVELFDEEFVLVRSSADGDKPVPEAGDLEALKLLLLEDGHCFRDQALSFCGVSASGARNVMDGSALSTLVHMVAAGVGVTLIPEMAVPIETRTASVSISRFGAPAPRRVIGMIWRRTNPMGEQLRRVSDLVRDVAHRAGAASQEGSREAASA
ncbi:MAG: LysR substrate-binding domain-containing protein [Cohaesibacteraceae bacterium]